MNPDRSHLARRPATRIGVVLAAALVATATIGSTAQAGDAWSPVQILRSAPTGDDLFVDDIAGRGDDLIVAWTEADVAGSRTYVRWSRDGAGSWGVVRSLLSSGHDDPRAIRVDICGPYAWAVQEEQDPDSGKEGADIPVLHRIHLGTYAHARWDLDLSHNDGVDVACGGDRFVAAVYEQVSFHSGTRSIWLSVRPVVPKAFPPQHLLVGSSADPGLAVSATNGAIQVAWFKNNRIKYRRFTVSNDATPVVTPFPVITVEALPGPGPWGGRPLLAAYGSRVVLAYRHSGGGARVRLSHDGATFGAPILSGPDSEAGWVPISVDMKERRILVELQEVTCCPDDTARPIGVLSPDLGDTWSDTSPRSVQGSQVGALYRSEGVPRVAEAWDRSLGPSVGSQRLRFQHGPE